MSNLKKPLNNLILPQYTYVILMRYKETYIGKLEKPIIQQKSSSMVN